MSEALDLSPGAPLLRTNVAVYLGDCTGATLPVVCDGSSIESRGSTWHRASLALACPTPRGPYPVCERFTVFVYETCDYAFTRPSAVVAFRIDVRCEGRLIYASVRSAQSSADLPPIPYLIGDDVVTTVRRLFQTTSWP